MAETRGDCWYANRGYMSPVHRLGKAVHLQKGSGAIRDQDRTQYRWRFSLLPRIITNQRVELFYTKQTDSKWEKGKCLYTSHSYTESKMCTRSVNFVDFMRKHIQNIWKWNLSTNHFIFQNGRHTHFSPRNHWKGLCSNTFKPPKKLL